MAAITEGTSRPFRVDHRDWDQFVETVQSVTVDPVRNLAAYVIPFLGTFGTNLLEVRSDDATQNGMMPLASRTHVLQELKHLQQAAGIEREIGVYSSLGHTFSSFGGAWSLSKPILGIPHHHLFRSERNCFGKETPDDQLAQDSWRLSDDQVRFSVARELANLQMNSSLYRLAIKVLFISALFFAYSLPFGLLIGGAAILGIVGLYIHSERALQGEMDCKAVEILTRAFNDPARAKEAALSTLRKELLQNKERREGNSLCRGYITEDGDNLFDLPRPPLTSRIDAIEAIPS